MSLLHKAVENLDVGYFKTWGTPLVYLLMYPYIVVFRQVSETLSYFIYSVVKAMEPG